MPKLPTAELVAVAYAKRVLSQASMTAPVVTTLPDASTWQATGAVQVEGIVGTTMHEQDLRDTVASYGGWAARPGSDKPPYGQANGLLELIRTSSWAGWSGPVVLDLEPSGVYRSVRVMGAMPVTEPRRIPDLDTSRAHYSMDFRLLWVTL